MTVSGARVARSIWGTGQDQCATIKRQLCLLLPGASVFLDVDDLEDIGMLEEYIEASGVVMIFVSQGYFKSANCLREVRSALSKDKPLSLVHDPVRGGASLEAIEAECPAEMRGDMFSRHRPVITFHRIKDFQMVSLRLLAEDLLLGCPNFGVQLSSSLKSFGKRPASAAAAAAKADTNKRADVQLALPNEITRKRLNFHTPVTVYASLYNPGAAAALEALQEGFLQLLEPIRRLTLTGAPLPSFSSTRGLSSCCSTLGGGGGGGVPEESCKGNCEGEGSISEADEVWSTNTSSDEAAADMAAALAVAAAPMPAEGDAPSLLATGHAEARRANVSCSQDSQSGESQAPADEGAEGSDAIAPRRSLSPPPSPPSPPPPATSVQRMKVAATVVVEMVSHIARQSSDLETQLESEGSQAPQPATRWRPKLGKRAQIRATAIPPWQVTTMASTSTSDGDDSAGRNGLRRVSQVLTGLSSSLGPGSEQKKRRLKSRAGGGATHMLLYLNKDTFVGEKGKTDARTAVTSPQG
jgi:hypothetical protein